MTNGRQRKIYLEGKQVLEHRAIFLMCNGYLPDFIDHIDGNPHNNDISNLRPCTLSQNQHNRRVQKNSKTGIKGLHYYRNMNKPWRAEATAKGCPDLNKHFCNKEDAIKALNDYRDKHHLEFKRQ